MSRRTDGLIVDDPDPLTMSVLLAEDVQRSMQAGLNAHLSMPVESADM